MNIKEIEKRLPVTFTAMEGSKHAAIQAAIELGEMLREAKDIKRGDFKDWLVKQKKVRINYQQASKYVRVATHKWEALENKDLTINELQKVLPKTNEPPRREAPKADTLAYVGKTPAAAVSSDQWNTPTPYIEAARAVLGSIDLDPFTSVAANKRIKAKQIMTEADDGFRAENWPAANGVWMNPPYSHGAAAKAVNALLENLTSGSIKSAIVLMNASTDTAWFHSLLAACCAVCLTQGRIAFLGPDGTPSKGNTKGQAFFYFGSHLDAFEEHFGHYGAVLQGAFDYE